MKRKLKIFIETHGCELNKAESNSISLLLSQAGHEIISSSPNADVIIINTCSVRESAETKVFGQLGIYKSQKLVSGCKLILTGCMAEHDTDVLLKKFPYIDYIVNNSCKQDILKIVNAIEEGNEYKQSYLEKQNYKFFGIHYNPVCVENYVPIQNGCNNFCSYCIVPYTRGREISRNKDEIISELLDLDERGVKIVTLLGQNVNSYNYNNNTFEDLVADIENQKFKNIVWMNFESPHPKDFTDKLIDILASSKYFVHHYHIPIQSANDRVLSLMNRRYGKKDIYTLFEKIKTNIPDSTFSSDIMLGFPTETEDEAQETIQAVKDIGFIDNYMYFYNPRPGTFAYKNYQDLPVDIKKNRLSRLIDIQQEISKRKREEQIGKVVDVIVKSKSRDKNILGVTASRESVVIAKGDFNKLYKVKIKGVSGKTLVGEILNNS